jgi:hypothetical protein
MGAGLKNSIELFSYLQDIIPVKPYAENDGL